MTPIITKASEWKPIRNLFHLIELASEPGGLSCYLTMGPAGTYRSWKRLWYSPPVPGKTGTFDVWNEIDDTEQNDLLPSDLWKESNIGEALDKGALYYYEERQ